MIALKELIEKPISGDWGIEGENVNVLRTTNFQNNGLINFENVVKRNVPEKVIKQKKLLRGDIIIEKSGGSPTQPVGRVVFFDTTGEYICNNFTSILRPKKDLIDSKYLHYILFANHKIGITEKFQNKTTGIINLQLSRFIENIQIPLPPLEIQKHIAQILNDAAALRDKTAQLIKECDALAQSIFLDMFGDPAFNYNNFPEQELVSLVRSSNDIKCGPFGTQLSKSEYVESGVPIWGIPQINSSFVKKPTEYITSEKSKTLEQYSVFPNDILMSRKGNVGTCSIYPKNWELGILHSDALRIRCDENKVNPVFLIWQFRISRSLIVQINNVSSGAIMAGINVSKLKNIRPIVPPITLQNQFAEKIALIEQQKELAKQELKESEDLFNCLLQKAFKGELT
ncbi:hypothetical protein CEY12_01200 [Chryseobacterium sp. T16E-39]|uniref:restriction endonuclease subunit S n=1 Tax=Chryseobacterium sp. T16E-39 TaxID=2015076 RepID=UPI000B5B3623|nr:restriction endonuclease subunit S [Chryseobacterium sp. T16E-39]ASK28806.1 hypothetical protein CEY12_01200 [Chryseobacterium sp. T16E-39]